MACTASKVRLAKFLLCFLSGTSSSRTWTSLLFEKRIDAENIFFSDALLCVDSLRMYALRYSVKECRWFDLATFSN